VKYHISTRVLHWMTAIAIIALIFSGFIMGGLPKEYKYIIYANHKKFGITVLIISLIRLILRLKFKSPDYPKNIIPKIQIYLGKLVHGLLYLFAVVTPLSGFLMSIFSGKKVIWFFGIDLPLIVEKNKNYAHIFHELHSIFVYTLLALLFLHIIGAIKHAVFDKYNIFKRII